MAIPTTRSPDNNDVLLPNNTDLERAIQDILRGADLNSVTKREIRRRLEDQFGMDLSSQKNSINAVIDRVLLSQA
jgi:chitin synthase